MPIGAVVLPVTVFFSSNNSRFVDRDMIMRYYWGLAIGHIYTHKPSRHGEAVPDLKAIQEDIQEDRAGIDTEDRELSYLTLGGADTEGLEHSLAIRDDDDFSDSETSEREEMQSDMSDDEMYAAM